VVKGPAPIERPHPSRCSPTRSDYAAIIKAHEAAVTLGEPNYRDPSTNLIVLTVATHRERGTCCGSGCRHCPYVED
jgi:hypothetical protein